MNNYSELFANYADLTKISFDYAVVEHEKDIEVLRFAGQWKDLGTWNTLTEAMEENVIGDAYLYRFVEADYERVEKELMKFADELALGKRIA